ncbi:MAG: diaminopimelate decarboxylase [Bacteroidaceae bacterium]|jgi:diaminopimelate decarboxylase|nr:diaminopimelate decarboxylase [Bacteroidaceae bacterium]
MENLLKDNKSLIEKFYSVKTPFYYYDTQLLDRTLQAIKNETDRHEGYHLHYAVKACTTPKVLSHITRAGFGADCVSGGEIQACLDAGFPAEKIVFAGVGKSDWEIELGLRAGIQYFNVESIPELEVINEIAAGMQKVAKVSFRINPNVGADTHANITTGLAENKFGIAMEDMEKVIALAGEMKNVEFVGLHFHIGSQIMEMGNFAALSNRINELQDRLEKQGICVKNINVGGGLGVDYDNPDGNPVPDFKAYFDTYAENLKLRPGQQLHFELGRAVVAQCGSLITKCLYVKKATAKQFIIVDAGMTDLIRPALYHASHKIENLSSDAVEETYDVVGPICESSDVFAKDYRVNATRRGDLLALRSAGAYGQIMASQYNCRPLPEGYTTEDLL